MALYNPGHVDACNHSSGLVPNPAPAIPYVPPTNKELEMLFQTRKSHISSPLDHHSSSVHHGVAGEQYAKVNPFAAADPEPFVNVFALDPTSEASIHLETLMPELNNPL
ncbi:hypothetical protein Tco_0991652 [Tanacetum coccineum]|uniref:Uncharacterized protein n=1 Tax=Tanacetum coccineum TaxID=301880 RepID=A0ABQ5F0M0_9ASTR